MWLPIGRKNSRKQYRLTHKIFDSTFKRYLRTPENMASLKCLIKTDIMGSIDKNIELGNITLEDGAQLYGNSERG